DPSPARTFHGRDPDTLVAAAISMSTPTSCQARTRLYRNGTLELHGFPVSDISEKLKEPDTIVWLDLPDPTHDDLSVLSDAFSLHPLAIEDAVLEHERPKLDRYRTHLFLTAYGVHLDGVTAQLPTTD